MTTPADESSRSGVAASDVRIGAMTGDEGYRFGPRVLPDGNVCFQLWAPALRSVELEIEGRPAMPMVSEDEGFHRLAVACEPGTRYRFRVGPDLAVPDPASRRQDGDVSGYSVVVDDAHAWRHTDWKGRPWAETVLYEIHCGLVGGFRGVQDRLPQLAELGVTAIELMPIADFPGLRNWGYDGVLPYAPDAAYGSPKELRELVDAAHGQGMMVFLDVVYNHFGPQGNYLSSYAPDFFRSDIHTPWGPAIDFRNPQVRSFFAENALYWLREYRFDGLRFDAVHAITERDWLPEMARFVRGHVEPGRHVHLVLENDDNDAGLLSEGFDAQWNDDAHHVMHHLLTGETQGYYAAYQKDPAKRLARFLAEGFVYQGEPSAARDGKPRGSTSAGLPPTAFVFFLQNHDQVGNRAMGERLAALCGTDSEALRAAIALQLLAPQIPLLFMGEEVGATSPFQYFTSYDDPELAKAVREGRRKEFAAFHEFEDAEARERIPDPNAVSTWEASKLPESADAAARRWREWYGMLLGLRRQYLVPHLDGARSDGAVVVADAAVHARWILNDGSTLSLYCNLGDREQSCDGLAADVRNGLLFLSRPPLRDGVRGGHLPPACTVATLVPAAGAARHE